MWVSREMGFQSKQYSNVSADVAIIRRQHDFKINSSPTVSMIFY